MPADCSVVKRRHPTVVSRFRIGNSCPGAAYECFLVNAGVAGRGESRLMVARFPGGFRVRTKVFGQNESFNTRSTGNLGCIKR